MKVALVHDFLREYGGAERVVETLHEMWPEAPLFTSFVDWGNLGDWGERFKNWDIRTSWVQHNWLVKKFHSPLRFLAPQIWESFDLSGYDVVISSSGWFICRGVNAGNGGPNAKKSSRVVGGVPWFSRRQGPDLFTHHSGMPAKAVTALETSRLPARISRPLHICYIHHPPRNLYGYATGSTLQRYWPVRVYATIINFFLRQYDYNTAQKVDYFIANSQETERRVKKFYRRESAVIYPPIDTHDLRFTKYDLREKKEYYLSVGRLTYSKRVDLAVGAANRLKIPLKIVGIGPEEESLKAIAGPTMEFMGSVSDEELAQLYAGAKALIFCALDEDFGMVPVEAMAHGTPVIALGQGGVLETVVDGETGVIFQEPEVEKLVEAIQRFNKTYTSYRYNKNCKEQAQKFSKERFKKELERFVIAHVPR